MLIHDIQCFAKVFRLYIYPKHKHLLFQQSYVRNLTTKSTKRKVGVTDFKQFEAFFKKKIHSLFHILIFLSSTIFYSPVLIYIYI